MAVEKKNNSEDVRKFSNRLYLDKSTPNLKLKKYLKTTFYSKMKKVITFSFTLFYSITAAGG